MASMVAGGGRADGSGVDVSESGWKTSLGCGRAEPLLVGGRRRVRAENGSGMSPWIGED